MAFFARLRIERKARFDARYGLRDPEGQANQYIRALLGPRPEFNPVNNPRDKQIAHDLANTSEIEEAEADLREVEGAQVTDSSHTSLLLQLGAFFVVEAIACTHVMRDLGVPSPERIYLAAMLAAFIFFLTGSCAKRASENKSLGRKKDPLFYLLIAAYGLIVFALAVVRTGATAGDEFSSHGFSFARALVLLAATLGPAWLAEDRLRRLIPAAQLARRRYQIRRRLWRLRRARNRARRAQWNLGKTQARWDRNEAIRRAAYRARFEQVLLQQRRKPKRGG